MGDVHSDELREIAKSLGQLGDLFDDEVIMPHRLEYPVSKYDERFSGSIERIDGLIEWIDAQSQIGISDQMGVYYQRTSFIIASVALVFLVIFYLYMGFFRSVKVSINAFSEFAR